MLEITQTLTLILMFAVLIQFCVDRVKEIAGERVMSRIKAPVWALAFGILFAFLFRLDVFAMLGMTASFPIVAFLVTGLILSAGASPIYELIKKLRQSRQHEELYFDMDANAAEMAKIESGGNEND